MRTLNANAWAIQVAPLAAADGLEQRHRAAGHGDYLFRLGDSVIDATLGGSDARYINHSCAPNCVAA